MKEDKKILEMGFQELQEKEHFIYYEKTSETEQIVILYDKKKDKVSSIDIYSVENGVLTMRSVEHIKELA